MNLLLKINGVKINALQSYVYIFINLYISFKTNIDLQIKNLNLKILTIIIYRLRYLKVNYLQVELLPQK